MEILSKAFPIMAIHLQRYMVHSYCFFLEILAVKLPAVIPLDTISWKTGSGSEQGRRLAWCSNDTNSLCYEVSFTLSIIRQTILSLFFHEKNKNVSLAISCQKSFIRECVHNIVLDNFFFSIFVILSICGIALY